MTTIDNTNTNSGHMGTGSPKQCKKLEAVLPPLREPGSHPSMPINYLDIELNDEFTTNSCSPHLTYITFTAYTDDRWVVAVKYLMKEHWMVVEMTSIIWKYIYYPNICHNGPNVWQVLAKHMTEIGIKQIQTADDCLNIFQNSLQLYAKALTCCPNSNIASVVNPLFPSMHTLIRKLGPFILDWLELNTLIKLFDDLIVDPIDDKPMTTGNSDYVADGCAIAVHIASATDKLINYLEVDINDTYKRNISYLYLPYKTQYVDSGELTLVCLKFRCEVEPAVNKLLELLDRFRYNIKVLAIDGWLTIGLKMIDYGFRDWTHLICIGCFRDGLNLYRKSLSVCPDAVTALLVNPLFNAYHTFNMDYIIDFQEIREINYLRYNFNNNLK